jgi:hypothetical protein
MALAGSICWSPRSQKSSRASFVYRKNERGGAHFANSQLVHQLRSEAWVPQRGGEFVRPAQAPRGAASGRIYLRSWLAMDQGNPIRQGRSVAE